MIVKAGKTIDSMGTPHCVQLCKHSRVKQPIIIVNYAAQIVGPLIKLPGNPFGLYKRIRYWTDRENTFKVNACS